MIPRGVPHAFMVTSGRARMLCLQTPGNGEAFFRNASDPVAAGESAAGRLRPGPGGAQTGAIEILGPPPF